MIQKSTSIYNAFIFSHHIFEDKQLIGRVQILLNSLVYPADKNASVPTDNQAKLQR